MPVVSLLFHDVYLRETCESGFLSAAADRYKLSVEEFDAQLAGLAEAPHPHDFLMTVDDGGVSYYTVIADRLEALGRRGHCFVSTAFIGQPGFLDAAQLRALHARGHVIGSHSVTHPARFSALSPDDMRREWSESRKMLEDHLGDGVNVASVPGGYYSRRVAETAHDAGIRTLFTSEPTTADRREGGCRIIGRFTIRHGDRPDAARRLVLPPPWSRCAAWASWNTKALVKPVLGSSYRHIADWWLGARTLEAGRLKGVSRGA